MPAITIPAMPDPPEVQLVMISRVNAARVVAIVLVWGWDGGGGGRSAAENSAGNTEVEGPLAASSDGRRLVSASGTPVPVLGDAAQGLMVNLSTAQANAYFAARAEQGFNAAWVNVLVTTYTGGREDAKTYDGIAPFTQTLSGDGEYDIRFPNETYFAHVDEIVAAAAEHGIHLFFDPIETGGFLDTLSANGLTAAREYGRFLGRRYKDANNIVWMSGNDFRTWTDDYYDKLVYEVALGIRDEDPRHLHTTELDDPLSSSLEDPRWHPILGINNTYTYFPTYAQLYVDWERNPHLPNVFIEGNYEGQALSHTIRVTTGFDVRNTMWWAVLAGATGAFGGNHWTNHFLPDWPSHLADSGADSVRYLRGFLTWKRWDLLEPDIHHTVAIAGYGTFSNCCTAQDNDYVTTARASDGSLVISYFPVPHDLVINMSSLAGPATAGWFDPATGTWTQDPDSEVPNAGLRVFTPPATLHADGSSDWVLVIGMPEPIRLAMLGAGAALLQWLARRRRVAGPALARGSRGTVRASRSPCASRRGRAGPRSRAGRCWAQGSSRGGNRLFDPHQKRRSRGRRNSLH